MIHLVVLTRMSSFEYMELIIRSRLRKDWNKSSTLREVHQIYRQDNIKLENYQVQWIVTEDNTNSTYDLDIWYTVDTCIKEPQRLRTCSLEFVRLRLVHLPTTSSETIGKPRWLSNCQLKIL